MAGPRQSGRRGIRRREPGGYPAVRLPASRSATREQMTLVRSFRAAVFMTVMMMIGTAAGAAEQTAVGSATGLPVPRFVSLKSDRVTVRAGPTKDQDVRWVFTRLALPVEVTAEFENWRRIRDREGAEGWVYHSLLSGRRTVLV